MPELHLLDACALLAFFNKEEGADIVADIIIRAKRGEIKLAVHAAQLIEVYYDRIRVNGLELADEIIRRIYDEWPVTVIEALDRDVVRQASRIKARGGKMSFADSLLIAAAKCAGAVIVTADWGELEKIEREGQVPFLWIRPKPEPRI